MEKRRLYLIDEAFYELYTHWETNFTIFSSWQVFPEEKWNVHLILICTVSV